MFKICELWTVILWYELNPRVRCAFGNVFLTDDNYLSQLIAGPRAGSDVTSSARVLGSRSVERGTDSIPASPNMITVRWWSCHVWTFQTLPLIACPSPLKFFDQVFLSLHRSISTKSICPSIEVLQPSISVSPSKIKYFCLFVFSHKYSNESCLQASAPIPYLAPDCLKYFERSFWHWRFR